MDVQGVYENIFEGMQKISQKVSGVSSLKFIIIKGRIGCVAPIKVYQ